MRSASEKKIIELIREQYEERIYTTLLEMETVGHGGKILIDAGLEVTNKEGEKFTVKSVQKNGDDPITVYLVPSTGIAGPITSINGATEVPSDQTPQVYSIEKFNQNFDI